MSQNDRDRLRVGDGYVVRGNADECAYEFAAPEQSLQFQASSRSEELKSHTVSGVRVVDPK